jgi:hypothetical protein
MTMQQRCSLSEGHCLDRADSWEWPSPCGLGQEQPGSDPLGIPCQLCYKPAEGWSGSLEDGSFDDGA